MSELQRERTVARTALQHARRGQRRHALTLATRAAGSPARPPLRRLLGALSLGLLRLAPGGDDQARRPRRHVALVLGVEAWFRAARARRAPSAIRTRAECWHGGRTR